MNKNSRKSNSGRSRGKNNRNNIQSSIQAGRVTTVPFAVDSFTLDQASSGNGGFTSQASAASLTAANGFNLDPYNLGGLPYRMGTNFIQYRLKWVKIGYKPYMSASGVVNTVSGATSTPSYGVRNFALGFSADPFIVLASYGSIIIGGGIEGNTSRPCQISMRGGTLNTWRYTSTTTASPSNIDLRMVAPVRVNVAFSNTSTTATLTYGGFLITGVMELRYPLDNAVPVGLSASIENTPLLSVEEQKSNKNTENASKDVKGWFS